jgi:hypothetical protein
MVNRTSRKVAGDVILLHLLIVMLSVSMCIAVAPLARGTGASEGGFAACEPVRIVDRAGTGPTVVHNENGHRQMPAATHLAELGPFETERRGFEPRPSGVVTMNEDLRRVSTDTHALSILVVTDHIFRIYLELQADRELQGPRQAP